MPALINYISNSIPFKKSSLFSTVCRTPLRYPGGKTLAISLFLGLTETLKKRVVSPFCGGSSAELAMASAHSLEVKCYDAHRPLIEFYQCAASDVDSLVSRTKDHYGAISALPEADQPGYYSELKASLAVANDNECAAAYFAANRLSFNGCLSGGMAKDCPRFQPPHIANLTKFAARIESLKISWHYGDFRDTIPQHDNDFLFLDPPYALEKGNNLYGINGELHESFDHYALAGLLKRHDYWLLCYNDCDLVRDLYDGYCILTPSWKYGMTKKPSSEVFILSHRLEQELRDSQNETFLKLLEDTKPPVAANESDPATLPPLPPMAIQIAKTVPIEKQKLVQRADGLYLRIISTKGKPRLVRAALDVNGKPIVKDGKVISIFAAAGAKKGATKRTAMTATNMPAGAKLAPTKVATKPVIRLKAVDGVLVPHIEKLSRRCGQLTKVYRPIAGYDDRSGKFLTCKRKSAEPVQRYSDKECHDLDKFYTKPETAKQCLDWMTPFMPANALLIEPSAGSGVFLKVARPHYKIHGFDIAPEAGGIRKIDFLTDDLPNVIGQPVDACIGNPPFKKAAHFTSRALEICPTVGFILPCSAEGYYFQSQINSKARLVFSQRLDVNSFTFNGKPAGRLQCCFQIWTTLDTGHPDLRIREPKKSDSSVKIERFSQKRHGTLTSVDLKKYHTGLTWYGAKIPPHEVLSKRSGYLIATNDDEAMRILHHIDFNAMAYAERVGRPGFSFDKFYRHFNIERDRYRSQHCDKFVQFIGMNDNPDLSLIGRGA